MLAQYLLTFRLILLLSVMRPACLMLPWAVLGKPTYVVITLTARHPHLMQVLCSTQRLPPSTVLQTPRGCRRQTLEGYTADLPCRHWSAGTCSTWAVS